MYKNWTSSAAAASNSGTAMNPSGYQSVLSKLPTEDAKKVRLLVLAWFTSSKEKTYLKPEGYENDVIFGEGQDDFSWSPLKKS